MQSDTVLSACTYIYFHGKGRKAWGDKIKLTRDNSTSKSTYTLSLSYYLRGVAINCITIRKPASRNGIHCLKNPRIESTHYRIPHSQYTHPFWAHFPAKV